MHSHLHMRLGVRFFSPNITCVKEKKKKIVFPTFICSMYQEYLRLNLVWTVCMVIILKIYYAWLNFFDICVEIWKLVIFALYPCLEQAWRTRAYRKNIRLLEKVFGQTEREVPHCIKGDQNKLDKPNGINVLSCFPCSADLE